MCMIILFIHSIFSGYHQTEPNYGIPIQIDLSNEVIEENNEDITVTYNILNDNHESDSDESDSDESENNSELSNNNYYDSDDENVDSDDESRNNESVGNNDSDLED